MLGIKQVERCSVGRISGFSGQKSPVQVKPRVIDVTVQVFYDPVLIEFVANKLVTRVQVCSSFFKPILVSLTASVMAELADV